MRKLATVSLLVLLAACAGDPPPDTKGLSSSDGSNRNGTAPGAIGRGALDPNARSGSLSDAQRQAYQDDLNSSAGDRVFFLTDRSDLTAEAQRILTGQVAWMRRFANLTFTIEGHADERGTREYNLALGDRRATTVRNFLIASGIPQNRLRTVSYGKERPTVVASNESGWAQNRRAVTTID